MCETKIVQAEIVPREMRIDPTTTWSEERRKSYLIDEKVSKPLSVDTAVWCSIFEGECCGVKWAHSEAQIWFKFWESLNIMDELLIKFGEQKLGKFSRLAITCIDPEYGSQ
jgi:hypothetical protein